jgi:hypothetical protein
MNPNSISPKVAVGGVAAGGSTPLSIIIIWVLGQIGLTVPPEIAASIAAVIAMVFSFVAGYITPAAAVAPSPPGTTAQDLNEAELRRVS